MPSGQNMKEECAQKTHQERKEEHVPSSSSSIQNPVINKKKTKVSAAKPLSQDVSSCSFSTDIKLLALLDNGHKTVPSPTTNMIVFETWGLRPTKKKVKKAKASLNALPAVQALELKSITSTRNDVIEKSCPQRYSESMKATPSETRTNHTYTPISEILQILGNEGNDVYVQFDKTAAMDVDVIQAPTSTSVNTLMIIVDTNVWIGQQLLVQELLKTDFQVLTETIKATLIIPWVVLQEIDNKILRESNNSRFRRGARIIQRLLSNNHPQVKGERESDAVVRNELQGLVADDSILNCAIKCSKLTQVKTVFLSNDIMLLNKALIYGLAAYKANNELISNLHRCLSDITDNYSTFICDTEESDINSAHQSQGFLSSNSFIASPFHVANSSFRPNYSAQHQVGTLDGLEIDVNDPMGMDVSELHHTKISVSRNEEMSTNPAQVSCSSSFDPPTFEAVATAVQQSLSSIIVPKLVEEYGKDNWRFATKVKPPFTVESAIRCIHAHWSAVFSFMFSSQSKYVVDQLIKMFHQMSASLSSTEVMTWRLTISQLTLVLLSNSENVSNRPRVADCCRLLQAYIQLEGNHST